MNSETYNPDQLTNAQLWGLGLSAILTQMNRAKHDRLHGSGSDLAAKKDIKHSLSVYWDINNRADLLENLEWLKNGGGHNRAFMEWMALFNNKTKKRVKAYCEHNQDKAAMQIVSQYAAKLSGIGIRAWDDGRYVSLSRWGATAGYISEHEAWGYILSHAATVQQVLSSWDQYAISYIAGKQYWQERVDEAFVLSEMEHVTYLMTNEYSPWVRLPWQESLL